MNLVDNTKLDVKVGNYSVGNADSVLNAAHLRQTRMRRRQLGQMMRAYDVELAQKKLPDGEYFISKKIDGEFCCVIYENNELITLNPGGTVRLGAEVHNEACRVLSEAGINSAMFGAELYVRRGDGERARVHDVVRVARVPKDQADADTLCLGVFNVYELDGVDLSMRYADAVERLSELFANSNKIHFVETVTGNKATVFEKFNEWVTEQGGEGVVVRSDSLGIYKIKKKHTLDLAILGFSTGVDDRSAMLHSLLLAIVREDNSFQVVARTGGGFSDEQRVSLLKQLESEVADSDYAEVNSDRVAYQMIKPGLVVEISCLDIVARTSHGSTIDKMVVEWNENTSKWEGVRRLPLCSILSPQFIRIRDDKTANATDVRMSQLSDIADIPEANRVAEDLKLPVSKMLRRTVGKKELKGHTMVRKLLLWQTNKQDVSRDFPAFVLHLTDFSPGRKSPLNHEIRVTDSEEQATALWDEWRKKVFVRGWTELDAE